MRCARIPASISLSDFDPAVNTICAQILALLELDSLSLDVVESLQRAGHQIVTCTNFAEAISLLQVTNFALIISDVHLENGGSVFDFLRWVRRNPLISATPFVLFGCVPTETAKYIEDSLRTSARLLGASMYLVMDQFDSNEFGRQIDSLLPNLESTIDLRGSDTLLRQP